MATINTYASLSEFKNWKRNPGGPDMSADATDDTVIEDLLEAASRHIDEETGGRTFYPRVETRYYSIPESYEDDRWIDGIVRSSRNARELTVDDDLLEIISLTNGDGTVIASSEYDLVPRNLSPKFAIRLKAGSAVMWEDDADGNIEDVIAVAAIWGYHDRYAQRAWKTGGTLGAALNISALSLTMTAGHSLAVGQVVKIDNELLIVTGISTNTITVNQRGENGSTAATHLSSATVKIWQPMDSIRQASLEIASNANSRRHGQNESGAASVSACCP